MYREIDDNELINMIMENRDSYEVMFEKYRPIIISICKDYQEKAKEIGYEFEDLIQVASMGLVDAINNYDANQNTLFYTFLLHCIRNKLRNEIRNQKTNKKAMLNKSISYDENIPGLNKSYLEICEDKTSPNPLKILIQELDEIEYVNFVNSLPLEVAVAYEMKNGGCSYQEISKFLKIEKPTITKYLTKARIELAKRKKALIS